MAIKSDLGEAHVDIVARLDRLEKDLKTGRKKTDQAAKQMDSSFKRVTNSLGGARSMLLKLTAGLATFAGARAMGAAIKRNLDFVDSIDKAAGKLGVTTSFFQQAEYAASQSGVAFGEVSNALGYVAFNAGEASKGVGEARTTFEELGIQLFDSNKNLKTTEQLFRESLAAISKLDSAVEKVQVARRIFGRSGTAIINMADNFDTLTAKAQAMGLVIDESVIKRGVEAKDELDTLSRVVRANLTAALVDLAPTLTGIGEHLAYVARWAGEAWARLSDILNLKPTSVEALRDRIGELDQQITQATEELRFYNHELGATGNLWERITRFTHGPKLAAATEDQIRVLRAEREALQQQLATMEAARVPRIEAPAMPEIMKPEELQARMRDLWKETNKERTKALSLWQEEASVAAEAWDDLSQSASSSMARMVADGEVSFKALGRAFVQHFTQQVIESLVLSRIFGFVAQGLASLAAPTPTTEYGPFKEGYRFDPIHDPLGSLGINTSLGASTSMVGQAAGPNIQIINSTGAPTQTQTMMDGSARVFIGQQGARDIWQGGDMAKALEGKYGLSAKGMRK